MGRSIETLRVILSVSSGVMVGFKFFKQGQILNQGTLLADFYFPLSAFIYVLILTRCVLYFFDKRGKNITKAMASKKKLSTFTPFATQHFHRYFSPGEKPQWDQQCQQPQWSLRLRESRQASPPQVTSSRIPPGVSLSCISQCTTL